MANYTKTSVERTTRQSGPVDLSVPYDDAWLRGKVAVITGGANGFGEGWSRRWADAGATVIIGDINQARGEQVVADIRQKTKSPTSAYFVHCNVTSWDSQVKYFKEAVKLSPHGGIDIVVANAGISGDDRFTMPVGLDKENPPKPNWNILDINLIGAMYTTHLGLFWLQKNPGSVASSPTSQVPSKRDRHLLLLGSIASVAPVPTQIQYSAAKHAMAGLFRSLRATSFANGIRVNMLCPYFIDTGILTAPARILLAGAAMGKPEDVVEAGTRLAADSRIAGRSLYVGPRARVETDAEGNFSLVEPGQELAKTKGVDAHIWEAYAHDFEDADAFVLRMVRLVNLVAAANGWSGWARDTVAAVWYGVSGTLGLRK